jgi:adenine phosphoribosyltransferase
MRKKPLDLKDTIRDIPDFPKKGIVFKDITTLIGQGDLFHHSIDQIAGYFQNKGIQKVVGIESRGFIIGAPLAYKLKAGLVPIRKKGKLPYKTISATYQLEYGTDTLEMHEDAFAPGENVLLVDDLLATGGTMSATIDLVNRLGGKIVGLGFIIELGFLNGRDKLKGYDIFSLIKY